MIKNNLYGNNGDMHKGFNHKRLAEIIKRLHSLGWKIVLSYNKTDEIGTGIAIFKSSLLSGSME